MPKVKKVIPPPTRRSTRVSSVKVEVKLKELGSKWSLEEKRIFLKGLKRHGPKNLNLIQQQFLPDRHLQDIERFVYRMKITSKKLLDDPPTQRRAPIETWLQEAQSLSAGEQDYSYALSQLFSIFGTIEPHDQLMQQNVSPNWGAIYQYLAELLLGNRPPLPSKMDSSIILDLLDQLATDLKAVDMTDQCRLMSLKYELLKQHVNIKDKDEAYRILQRALEEDPLDGNAATSSDPESSSNLPVATEDPGPSTSGPTSNQSPPSANSKSRSKIIAPRKTPLYSLNPFNIPIKHLKLKPKLS